MNNDKKIKNKENHISVKKKKRSIFKQVLKVFKIFILLIVFVGLLIGGVLFYKYSPMLSKCKSEANTILSTVSSDDFKKNATSHVFDSDGKEIFEIKQDKNLEYMKYDDIPLEIRQAFVAVEDKTFFEHSGIDIKSLFRAGLAYVKNNGTITQGGSTITQQLVKLTYLSNEQKMDRKIKEIYIAMELEKMFTKEQILEFYTNNVYFNNNSYGINSAAKTYFHKNVNELTLSESTFLCAIPNNPSYYDPYKNKAHTIERQHKILKDMLDENYITQNQYDTTINQEIVVQPLVNNKDTTFDSRKDFVTKDVVEILMKKNNFDFKYSFNSYDEKEQYQKSYTDAYAIALGKLYRGGYNIYTSLDSKMQSTVQKIIDNSLTSDMSKSKDGIYTLQAASVTLENSTGLIKTIVGGRTSPTVDYLNRASNSFRQNGSTMKPIGVYIPAFDILGYVPNTVKNDSPISGGPKNSGSYYGDITLRKALTISSNTVASKVYSEVTPQKGMKYLQEMQFENIVSDDMRLPSGLGGLTLGTNTKEMAAAFATIENKGKFNNATCVVSIDQISNGVNIYKHISLDKKIYKESSAVMVRDMMKDVITDGTAKGHQLANNIECAGKTGTTNDNKDGWFVGFSPIYTTSVWVGYDVPKTISSLYGDVVPSGIWENIMNEYHRNDKDLKFEESNQVREVWINYKGDEVPEGQGTREIFPINNLPTKDQESFDELGKEQYLEKINEIGNDGTSTIDTIESSLNTLKDEITSSDLSIDAKSYLYSKITSRIYNIKNPWAKKDKSSTTVDNNVGEETSNTSSTPSTPSIPSTPSTPSIPSTPSTPSTPSIPSTPSTPSNPSTIEKKVVENVPTINGNSNNQQQTPTTKN